jgi:predicted alpha-1,6-mannanase (GH76 family)
VAISGGWAGAPGCCSPLRTGPLAEVIQVLAARAPGLAEALEHARARGAPYRILGGKVVGAARCREKTLSRTRMVRSGRRPGFGILASAITVAVIAVATAAISGTAASASVRATSPQKAGMAELMKSYHPHSGLIGNSWWQAAVALSAVETYQQATGDTRYSRAIFTAFKDHERGKFENSYTDDTGWWGLAWLQAYDITRSRRYLAMAETDANYMHRYWDNTCGGGVWWRTTKAYKNAITNEVFLELTAWLHNTIRGDTKYLSWAKAEWSWFKGSGMINKSDLINDGLNSRCVNNHATTWTYNQGVILAGLARLYQATKDSRLLRTAEGIGKAAISHLTIGGVLHEPCGGTVCGNSTSGARGSFKGIFVQDLKVLAVTARTSQFSSFFEKQARSIEAHDTSRHHQFGPLWAGPIIDPTPYSQVSAEDALVAALKRTDGRHLPGSAIEFRYDSGDDRLQPGLPAASSDSTRRRHSGLA